MFNLPQEIFDCVSDHLDLSAVLSLRCTCKYFLKMMSSRHIWSSFARKLQSNPQVTKQEECVEDYTTPELQDWVLRHHKAQELLHTDMDAQFKKRGVLRSGVGQVELLPGGRWLLFIRGSDMFFVDCDTASLEPQVLIPTETPTRNTLVRFSTWIDLDAPRLAFRVAMIHWEKMKVDLSPRGFWVEFYDVNLVGHGSTAKLVSKPQGQGRQYSGTIIRNTHFEGLNDDYFIQLRIASDHAETEDADGMEVLSIQVVDYKNPSSSLDFYEVYLNGMRTFALDFYVLPGNRFAAIDLDSLFIYPVPNEGTKELTALYALRLRLPKTTISTYFRSGLHIDEDCTTIVYRQEITRYYMTNTNTSVVRIPHDVRECPTIQPSADIDSILFGGALLLLVCLWSAIAILENETGEQRVRIMNYSWSGSGGAKEFGIDDVSGDRIRAFDEGVGRMVIQDHAYGDTTIFDVV